ncbi:MAG: glycogen debranching enzyme family protein [Chloroflexi bacterium]|nr:glycogen debranching enzyme family protein [Chloroflexota bacterium]
MLTLGKEYLNDFAIATSREWLVANGLGGYASSTIVGANTRRYHGMLIAALDPPVRRTLLLYKIDEEIEVENATFSLACNEYHDHTVMPSGYERMQEFRLDGNMPTFVFSVPGAVLEKTVWMEYGQNTTYVRYALREFSHPAILRLNLLVSYRDHHGHLEGANCRVFDVAPVAGGWEFRSPSETTALRVLTRAVVEFEPTGYWHWRFLHRRELERGLDFLEDAYSPGLLIVNLQPGDAVMIAATAEDPDVVLHGMADGFEREKRRREETVARSEAFDPFARQLVLAADRFIASRRQDGVAHDRDEPFRSVIAGYHWFTDWGRDTFVSLPGLFLSTGRFSEARTLLNSFAGYLSEGMLPNYFPDDGAPPTYNSVDAALWYVYAVDRYLQRTDDLATVEQLFPQLQQIVTCYLKGARYKVGVDPSDGLLRAGEEGVQLTWMDAKVDDWVVTARHGKPVEINALWYNTLAAMATFARRIGEPVSGHADLANRAWESFNEKFWNGDGGYLFDVIDSHLGQDASFRPNQLLSISLPYPVLRRDRWQTVLDKVGERLLTPFGLRTLPRNDPMYVGSYLGDQRHRDVAYHQGTVWPWLLGQFVDAHLKVYGDKAAARAFITAFESHLKDAGVGFIGEIFDGDWPYAPQGCIAQAWSVAEVLRVWLATI